MAARGSEPVRAGDDGHPGRIAAAAGDASCVAADLGRPGRRMHRSRRAERVVRLSPSGPGTAAVTPAPAKEEPMTAVVTTLSPWMPRSSTSRPRRALARRLSHAARCAGPVRRPMALFEQRSAAAAIGSGRCVPPRFGLPSWETYALDPRRHVRRVASCRRATTKRCTSWSTRCSPPASIPACRLGDVFIEGLRGGRVALLFQGASLRSTA